MNLYENIKSSLRESESPTVVLNFEYLYNDEGATTINGYDIVADETGVYDLFADYTLLGSSGDTFEYEYNSEDDTVRCSKVGKNLWFILTGEEFTIANETLNEAESLKEDFDLKSDDEIEQEVENYRVSQLDKINKNREEDEANHKSYMQRRKEELRDYKKNRAERLKKYQDENDPNEERLNAKREELRQKREQDRADYQRWFEQAKEEFKDDFSNVEALTDLTNMENPGNWHYGGFHVRFTYNGKSYEIGWYDDEVYLPTKSGTRRLIACREIPNNGVHKWGDVPTIREMEPEDFGIPTTSNRRVLPKKIDLSKLD